MALAARPDWEVCRAAQPTGAKGVAPSSLACGGRGGFGRALSPRGAEGEASHLLAEGLGDEKEKIERKNILTTTYSPLFWSVPYFGKRTD